MQKTAQACADLLTVWKQSYIDTRAFIENSGVGSRWEFDKNVIFADLDHIARVCRDIVKVSESFVHFEEIFNNNLRSIVTQPEEVDNMMKKVGRMHLIVLCTIQIVFATIALNHTAMV